MRMKNNGYVERIDNILVAESLMTMTFIVTDTDAMYTGLGYFPSYDDFQLHSYFRTDL